MAVDARHMTTHQLAAKLSEMPNLPVYIRDTWNGGWEELWSNDLQIDKIRVLAAAEPIEAATLQP